jgi:hypothetical protein
MRIAVGLLAALGAGALTSALADPPTEAAPATTAAPAAPAPAAPAPAAATAAAPATAAPAETAAADQTVLIKAQLDRDTQHFLAEGYKPEIRHGEQFYCRKETALGSRLSTVKTCGTIEQLKLNEQEAKTNVSDMQRAQVGTSSH